jgi:4-fold beta flower protein
MDTTIYDKNGEPVAYVADDYSGTIYLWEGEPVAYVYEEVHVYGFNGRHLGWFRNDVLYSPDGTRVGFTSSTCPISISKSPLKSKRGRAGEIRPRWKAPAPPKFTLRLSDQDLGELLKQGGTTLRPVERAKESVKE